MTIQCWTPGTQYNYGDVVEYQGCKYKIIQPHRSQSDWAPGPATAALWGVIDDCNYGGDNKGYQQQQSYHQTTQFDQQAQYQQQQQQQQQQPQQQQQQPKEEEKHWYGDEANKKKLEIGGGIAAGAALLAGGMFALKKHEEHKQQTSSQNWARSNWLDEAKQRGNRRSGPATWILTHEQVIPNDAILVGREKSWNLYICRAYHEGGIQLGKASQAFKNGGVLGYENKEVFVKEYEVLVGDMNQLRWVPATGRLNLGALGGYTPIEAGRENDGTILYIAEAPYDGAVHPGKASTKLDGAYIAYGGKEKNIKEYRVLCYNNNSNYSSGGNMNYSSNSTNYSSSHGSSYMNYNK